MSVNVKTEEGLLMVAGKPYGDYVTPQMFGAVGDGEHDDTQPFIDALQSNYSVCIPDGIYKITGVEVPEYKTIYSNGTVTINTSATIKLDTGASFIGDNIHVKVTANDIDAFTMSKWAKVKVNSVKGVVPSTGTHGDNATGSAFNCTYSDFLTIEVDSITDFKYAFFIKAGNSGSGNTINDSVFHSKWVGDCYYAIFQAGAGSVHINSDMYIEYCRYGLSLQDSFTGHHTFTFDEVTNWFEVRNTDWKARLGEVYINNKTAVQFIESVNINNFMNTRFYLYDSLISASWTDMEGTNDGRLMFHSGTASMRIIGVNSASHRSHISPNDLGGGISNTIADYGNFMIESINGTVRTKLLEIKRNSEMYARNGLLVGENTSDYKHIKIMYGGLNFLNAPYNDANIPNNSIFLGRDGNLKFKNGSGEVKTISLT